MRNNIKDLFRESMSRLGAGVTIVTANVDNRPWGLTVSACSSISMEPPLIMVSTANNTVSSKAIIDEKRFNVAILNEYQIDTSLAGAKSGQPKFFEQYMEKNENGEYTQVKGALSNISCKLYKTVEAGDHMIFIGQVKEVVLGNKNHPLLYFDRQFGTFKEHTNSKSQTS